MDEIRLKELAKRCGERQMLEVSYFLTPAERYEAEKWASKDTDTRPVFFGGNVNCERTCAFFLPFYIDENDIEYGNYIKAAKITARFAAPSHRDYMGSILGLGIERDRIGDIITGEECAYVFCTSAVLPVILDIERVGRAGAKAEEIDIADVPLREVNMKRVEFSVMSPRLDAVVSGMFGLSRTKAASVIEQERVSLNYSVVSKTDVQIKPGDIITLKGKGKGIAGEQKGLSKKGRIYMEAQIYI